jgi:hypothetical protein
LKVNSQALSLRRQDLRKAGFESFSVPDWDRDSLQLRENLAQVLNEILGAARRREPPWTETAWLHP